MDHCCHPGLQVKSDVSQVQFFQGSAELSGLRFGLSLMKINGRPLHLPSSANKRIK